MIQHTPCIICREKDNLAALDQLKRIERRFSGVTPTDEGAKHLDFEMDIHAHCRYGMLCPSLNAKLMEAYEVARRISPVLTTIICGNDNGQYQELLRLLQGHFPYVYRECERLHGLH